MVKESDPAVMYDVQTLPSGSGYSKSSLFVYRDITSVLGEEAELRFQEFFQFYVT